MKQRRKEQLHHMKALESEQKAKVGVTIMEHKYLTT